MILEVLSGPTKTGPAAAAAAGPEEEQVFRAAVRNEKSRICETFKV